MTQVLLYGALRDDRNTGRCKLSLELLSSLSIKVGDLINVSFKSNDVIKTAICTAWPLTEPHSIPSARVDALVWFNNDQNNDNNNKPDSFIDSKGKPTCVISKMKETVQVAQKIRVIYVPAMEGTTESDTMNQSMDDLISRAKELDLNSNEKRMFRSFLASKVVKQGCVINTTHQYASLIIMETIPSGVVQITPATDIQVIPPEKTQQKGKIVTVVTDKSQQSSVAYDPNLDPLGGMEAAKNSLLEMVFLPFRYPAAFEHLKLTPPKGILIKGPPGVGKTLLVKHICNLCQAIMFVINAGDIYGPYLGDAESKLRETFLMAQSTPPGTPAVIFIDEIDVLCPKRTEHHSNESRVVGQLLTLMDGIESRNHNVIVIGATNLPNQIDPALRRPGRFDREIEVPVPNADERTKILQTVTKKMILQNDVDLDELSRMLPGYVGADLAALAREALLIALQGNSNVLFDKNNNIQDINISVSMEHFVRAMGTVTPSIARDHRFDLSPASWNDVGGLKQVKEELLEFVLWPLSANRAVFKSMGVTPPKGVLLYGPPGNGKTLLVRAIATASKQKDLNTNLVYISGADIYSPYVGDAEQTIRNTFKQARMTSPCIVFIDEIDAILGKRKKVTGVSERILTTLLTEIDGVEKLNDVLLIAASNRPDSLDSALTRPGRIDRKLFVGPPNEEDRLDILRVHTRKMPLGGSVDLAKLAKQTEHFSAADLSNVCREAGMIALRQDINIQHVEGIHFEEALRVMKPSNLNYWSSTAQHMGSDAKFNFVN